MTPKVLPTWKRLFDKALIGDDCWEWQASRTQVGYGQISVNGRMQPAHRVAYELLVGPIPEGLHIDHLCRNRGCVNPAHLEPVTCRENVLRGTSRQAENAKKTHCLRGHEFIPENTSIVPGGRQCRECNRAHQRRYAAQRRAVC